MVQRYNQCNWCGGEYSPNDIMQKADDGEYVKYSDYEKLVKHIEALKSVCETYIPTDKMDEANSKVILLCIGNVEEIGRKLIAQQALKEAEK